MFCSPSYILEILWGDPARGARMTQKAPAGLLEGPPKFEKTLFRLVRTRVEGPQKYFSTPKIFRTRPTLEIILKSWSKLQFSIKFSIIVKFGWNSRTSPCPSSNTFEYFFCVSSARAFRWLYLPWIYIPLSVLSKQGRNHNIPHGTHVCRKWAL